MIPGFPPPAARTAHAARTTCVALSALGVTMVLATVGLLAALPTSASPTLDVHGTASGKVELRAGHGAPAADWRSLRDPLVPRDASSSTAADTPRLAASSGTGPAAGRPAGAPPPVDKPGERDTWFYSQRTAGTNRGFTLDDAALARSRAAQTVLAMQQANRVLAAGPAGFAGAWENVGPDPIASSSRAYSGRVSALAVRSSPPYTIYLGAAQGGLWVSSTLTAGWITRSDTLPTQAIGAIALAPSNENIVYVGTGEGAFSGDSYFGNGVYRSDDGGRTFRHVSGDAIVQSSISRVVVDPGDPDHLYIATLRGVAGIRSVAPAGNSPYGVWESRDGGVTWQPRNTTQTNRGATDLVMDPLNPQVLLASFWMQGIVKTVDGGQTWYPAMTGLPANADWANNTARSRIALGLSHPAPDAPAVVYAGFNWADTNGTNNASTVWRSNDAGETWTESARSVVRGYCGGQCWYDNEIVVDPTNPEVVFALGLWNYSTGSGGVFRSMDGGQSWVDIGYGQHPDYHAAAIRRDRPEYIVIGNDGGVWSSPNRGGRLAGEPYTATNWTNLNGAVSGDGVTGYGIMSAQYVGIAQHPSDPETLYGGTQDNGTHRRLGPGNGNAWRIIQGGDGGQPLVDPFEPRWVYGTNYNITPYRFADGAYGAPAIYIQNGITTSDRSAFYIPFAMDPEETHRLYLGSFRLYRTDDRGDRWQAVSGDLTSGCTSSLQSPTNYACVITAIGPSAGAAAVYVGTGDGRVQRTTNAYADAPVWQRVDKPPLPARPVTSFAVDRSSYRLAYVAFGGFDGGTPAQPGHVFKTTDGGLTWTNISGNLPDAPVNSVVLDASDPNTLYVGTDVGPLFTADGGATWAPMGTGFPVVAVWQLDLNPYTRQIAAGTHGRAVWTMRDPATEVPALQVRAWPSNVPAGPGSLLTYTLQVRNVGNATATGVTLRNPIPGGTNFVSATGGATETDGAALWTGQSVPVSGTLRVAFTVRVAADTADGAVILSDGITVRSAEGPSAAGSPVLVPLAPPAAASLTPASQLDGTRAGQSIPYTLTVENRGYKPSAFDLAVASQWPTTLHDTTFTAQVAQSPILQPGARFEVGVRVAVPADIGPEARDLARITATSTVDAEVQTSAAITTLGVVHEVLLVDNSTNQPDVTGLYAAAVRSAGHRFDTWNLRGPIPLPKRYLHAYRVLVWWTGSAYPGPLLPYESALAGYLDGGGRLFLSGMDLLDQAAGTTPFVRNYLHVDWDGSNRQNDIGSPFVTADVSNTVTAGLGRIGLDVVAVYGDDYSNQITPIAPAVPAFRDEHGVPDALTAAAGAYRLLFLAFPFEALTDIDKRNELMARAMDWFGLQRRFEIHLPILLNNPRSSPW